MAFPTGYTLYQEVVIDNTKVSADQTDFVLYIALSDLSKAGADIFDTCKTDGGDIRVTKSDGTTELAREIVDIDTTGKTGSLYVKFAGTLSSSSDTTIRVWYNGTDTEPATTATYGRDNVWTGYHAVWHMNEDPSGTAPQITDSTGNGHDGTSEGTMLTGDSIAGPTSIEHNFLDFDGSDDAIDSGVLGSFGSSFSSEYFFSCWIKSSASSGAFMGVVNSGANTVWQFTIANSTKVSNFIRDDGNLSNTGLSDPSDLMDGSWHQAHGSYVDERTGDDNIIYEDGASTNSSQGNDANGGTTSNFEYSFYLGARAVAGAADTHAAAAIGEVRLSLTDRDADFVTTDNNNQADPDTFYSTGDEQADYILYQELTVDSAKVAADETDFVLYVALSDLSKAGADIFDTCKTDGSDIRVTKSDGTTQLAREIVDIDTTGKTGALYVKFAGTLSSSSDTTIRIWYNGVDSEPATTATYGRDNVWSGYHAVYHMNEDPSGTAPQIADSTGNGHDGTSNGSMTGGDSISGPSTIEHNALDFDGSDDYLDVGTLGDFGSNCGVEMSFSFWVKTTDTTSSAAFGSVNSVTNTSNQLSLGFNATSDKITWAMRQPSGSITRSYDTSTEINDGNWNLIHGLHEDGGTGDDQEFYKDGTKISTLELDDGVGSMVDFNENFVIAAWNVRGSILDEANADYCEFRISTSVVTADYITTDNNNQSDPDTFYSTGDEIGGATVVTATKLSYTLTQIAPTVSAGVTVTASKLTYTLTQIAPVVSAGTSVTVSASKLTYTLTQIAPVVSAGTSVTVTASKLTYTLTQIAPTVSAGTGVTVTANKLVYTLTQIAPVISAGTSVTVAATKLAYTLTQIAPTISAGTSVTVSASKQTYSLTQIDPTVSVGGAVTVSATKQAFTLTQIAPSISAGVTVSATKQTFTLTQIDPVISVGTGVTVSATKLAYTLTQIAPTISAGVTITASKQAYVLTQIAPVITTGAVDDSVNEILSLTSTIVTELNLESDILPILALESITHENLV